MYIAAYDLCGSGPTALRMKLSETAIRGAVPLAAMDSEVVIFLSFRVQIWSERRPDAACR